MPYDLAEHRHRFAVWAAARAAQRGFTTVRNLRDALQATDIRAVLASPSTFEYSATQCDELHRRWCLSICASLADRGLSKEKATYGRAAKLVAVYFKAIVMMGEQWDSRFARNMHPPIDRVLLQGLAASKAITRAVTVRPRARLEMFIEFGALWTHEHPTVFTTPPPL